MRWTRPRFGPRARRRRFRERPYSQAITANGLVFVSGQLGLTPGHAEMAGDTIEEQTRQIFDNLEAILTAAGSGSTGS